VLATSSPPCSGQPIVIENRPGASGVTGTEFVAKSAPDGYMLIAYFIGSTASRRRSRMFPYDPQRTWRDHLVAKVPGSPGADPEATSRRCGS